MDEVVSMEDINYADVIGQVSEFNQMDDHHHHP
jgi:hypothetical protein